MSMILEIDHDLTERELTHFKRGHLKTKHDNNFSLRVALIGYGNWGKILAQKIEAHPCFELVTICTSKPDIAVNHPRVKVYNTPIEAMSQQINLAVIATPPDTHYQMVMRALMSGLHVLVEKPISTNVEDVKKLINASRMYNREVFVDHTFLFTDAFKIIRNEVADWSSISVDSIRTNTVVSNMPLLYDIGMHDVAILKAIMRRLPTRTAAISTNTHESCVCVLNYDREKVSGSARILLANERPEKIRKITIVGSGGSIIWEETPFPKLLINRSCKKLNGTDAISNLFTHIYDVIEGSAINNIVSAIDGLEVIKVLDSIQESTVYV
jgi:predicted dehydrogenase